mgnify:CR=1 FL=1
MNAILRNRALWGLSFGHFAVDLYNNILPVTYPLLMGVLELNYTRIGLIATCSVLVSSTTLPILGYASDRFGSRFLGTFGVAWIALCMGLVGLVPSYGALLLLFSFATLGSAAYHSQGMANASRVSGPHKAGSMSIFSTGGNLGYALSPIMAATAFRLFGLKGSLALAPLGLLAASILYQVMGQVEQKTADRVDCPEREAIRPEQKAENQPLKIFRALKGQEQVYSSLIALLVLVMLRSWTHQALTNYIPLLYKELGTMAEVGSAVLSALLLGTTLGTAVGGFLSDRFGLWRVIFFTLLAEGPLIFAFLHLTYPLTLLIGPVMGFLWGCAQAPLIVAGQALFPRHLGTISGLILGVSFATAGLGVYFTGRVADFYSLQVSLNLLAGLPLAGALLCLAFYTHFKN